MVRPRVGLVMILGALAAAAGPAAGAVAASAAARTAAVAASAVPQAGDWEGTGPHGLPLSFELARHGGHIVATSLAVGYPASCPALARDTEGVPLTSPAYAGPAGTTGPAAGAGKSRRV